MKNVADVLSPKRMSTKRIETEAPSVPSAMSITRPKIFEPSIRLYERPVHPEFFRIVATKTILRKEYSVALSITSVGHVIDWTDGRQTLSEVLSTNRRELPSSAIAFRSLREFSPQTIALSEKTFYQNSSRIEEVPPEFFGTFERELIRHLEPDGLLYRFGFSGRMALGGVGYIGVESRAHALTIRSIHTFPDDVALLRTESRIRLD